jgi:hypothetical protein
MHGSCVVVPSSRVGGKYSHELHFVVTKKDPCMLTFSYSWDLTKIQMGIKIQKNEKNENQST